MRVTVVLDQLSTHKADTATLWLVRALIHRGHHIWVTDAVSLGVDDCDRAIATARRPLEASGSAAQFLALLQSLPPERICLGEMDRVLLRCNPGKGTAGAWAYTALLGIARLAEAAGAVVLNAPDGLARGLDKLYFHAFPRAVRPRGIVSRDPQILREFVASTSGPVVLKPLSGSGGAGVFMVRPGERTNLNAIIEVNTLGGYAVAQEYLPAAVHGDIRMLLINGEPLRSGDKWAVVARVPGGGDLRSNVAAGGSAAPAKISDTLLEIAAQVGPRLRADGIFLAGLDVIGDKLVEINVFSPGGMQDICAFTGEDFSAPLIDAIEAHPAG